MDSVFQELKRTREAKHLSLADVSDATLINVNFLDAIEQGNTTVLPQTYIRAFIREYATFVGLDPVEIMKKYDQELAGKEHPAEPEKPPETLPAPPPEKKAEPQDVDRAPRPSLAPGISRFGFPAVIFIALGIILWNLTRTGSSPPPQQQIPDDAAMTSAGIGDSSAAKSSVHNKKRVQPSDSLTLRASVSDTSWVQIIIDDQAPQQYIFRPNRKITWKARDRFRLWVGNAGALDLTLNDRPLGAPGKPRAIVRDLELNRQTLQKK
jgi:cytoskeletal protein RodZ